MTKHWNRLFNIDILGVLRGQNSKSAFAEKSSEGSIRKKLRKQLRCIRDGSLKNVGHHPLIFTEVGIPYDLDNENAHETGDYRSQIKVMDAYHYALEGSSANGFTMWGDMTENNVRSGDQLNNEDLELLESHTSRPLSSISLGSSHGCSTEQSMEVDPHVQDLLDMWYMSIRQGAKAIMPRTYCDQSQGMVPQRRGYRPSIAYLRPSPVRVNGRLDRHGFDMEKCTFTMTLTAEGTTFHSPSVIYLPYYYFTDGETKVTVSGGQWKIVEQDDNNVKTQCLLWWHGKGTVDILIEGKHKDVWY
ncbi:hypothetical protein N7507_010293 [Penicillium longicatenatum]|nr:hypothetical protein N7507_010293 [Penicillium longicatenatum]